MSDLSLSMKVPLDSDGFLRRECPTCEREFKWLPSGEGQAESPLDGGYYCPYCAIQAPPGSWWTKAQLVQARAVVTSEVVQPEIDKLRQAMENMARSSGGLIEARLTSSQSGGQRVPALTETNDMRRVDFVCHPSEPVKVIETWTGPVHCLICGQVAGLMAAAT